MTWRTAHAIDSLRSEINQRWPARSKVSDGTIGAASRTSDHNPWLSVDGVGVVRAFDCTAVGIDADAYAEFMRARGIAGDPRLVGGGYVIWNKRIASERDNWAWRRYTGSNGHTHHIHVSLSRNPAGFDSRATWGISGIGRPQPTPDPNVGRKWHGFKAGVTDTQLYKAGYRNDEVAELQLLLAKIGLYKGKVDGSYGPVTVTALINFKDRASWVDESGKKDRSSGVTSTLIAALRKIAAAG